MNDHDKHVADPVEALIDALQAGDPLAEEVERVLNETGGPVPVDEAELRAAVASVHAKIRGERARERRWLPRRLLVAALVLCTVGFGAYGLATFTEPTELAASGDVDIRTGSQVAVRDDTVLLSDGVVTVSRNGAAHSGAHRVRVESLGVTVEPIGTVFHVGTREHLTAIWVEEGRVRLLHDRQGHLGEIDAGGWALLTGNDAGVQVHRVQEGQFDAAELGLDEGAHQLLADIRWMALPAETRAGILGGDAP